MLDSVSTVAAAPSAVKVPSVIGVCNKFDVPAVADIHPVSLDLAVVVPAVPAVANILMLLMFLMLLHYFVELFSFVPFRKALYSVE